MNIWGRVGWGGAGWGNHILEKAVDAEQVAQQVLEMAPQAPAGESPGPLPSQLQHFHM